MVDIDKAWIAGLFEGEGCIYKDPRFNAIRLTLNSTDKDIIDRLHAIVQCGNVRFVKFPEYKKHYKPAWCWTVWKAKDVKRLLVIMLPFLGERRAYHALNALDTLELDKKRPV